ncbi:hypothetical protein H4217_000084 [Coemansia sp. RSA 1939]|nr:hypothetical protein H4217_000084 [Coemansia sp. RSA 1939]KAJ2618247.1 hypothetical protein EV177_000097 [Coemansia sp. RSA 1804]KAJ2695563.1 hypothetical protein GGH99_000065 [Coemansia sp. RSA 1285]
MPTNVRPTAKRAPEVVVFNDTTRAKPTSSKHEYKAFMATKISKLNSDTSATAPRKTKEEEREEQEDRRHDREVEDLLTEGRLMIERLHESQLSGRERHKHNTQKLAKLGMKVRGKEKMPADMFFAVQKNRQARADKHIQDAKDRGILNASMKRELELLYTGKSSAEDKRDSRPRKDTDRGLRIGSGRFKDGVLHISKSHIDRVSGSGSAARVGKSKRSGNPHKRASDGAGGGGSKKHRR